MLLEIVVRTYLCGGAGSDVPSFDSKLERLLLSCQQVKEGDVTRIGVRNAKGNIYRVVEVDGVAEFVSAYHAFLAAGLSALGGTLRGPEWQLIVG